MLSVALPLPSMLIFTLWSFSTPVKAAPVNWDPWSVLKISGMRMLSKRPLQRTDAKTLVHRHRNLPGQDVSAVPIHNRSQEHKTSLQPDIRQIAAPDLTGTVYIHPAQEIWIYFMARGGYGGALLGCYGNQPHQPHQPLYSLAIYLVPLPAEISFHATTSKKRMTCVLLVDHTHQLLILLQSPYLESGNSSLETNPAAHTAC